VRQRGGSSAPVTFFSFQDVMLSLIGITIVITMILVLQAANWSVKAVARASGKDDARTASAVERTRALSSHAAALEYAVRQAQQRPSGDPLAKRASLRQELVSAAGKLDELERQSAELVKQLRELTLEHPEAGALVQVAELMRRRDEMLGELQTLERRRRISFILDAAQPGKPVLLEVSGTRIVACDLSANGVAVRIAAGTAASQVNDAIEFYRTMSAGQDAYLLLVVKPSGIAQYWSIRAAIDAMPEAARPRVGLDLIPEDAYVSELFPSALTGGEP
jgi:hypothetical protein